MHTYTPIFIVMDHIDTVEVYRFHKYKNLFIFIYFDIQITAYIFSYFVSYRIQKFA